MLLMVFIWYHEILEYAWKRFSSWTSSKSPEILFPQLWPSWMEHITAMLIDQCWYSWLQSYSYCHTRVQVWVMKLYLSFSALTLGWASGRASGMQKLSDEVLMWLSVWSMVQIVCIWSSWCHCIPKPYHLLRHLNPDWFYLSGTGFLVLSWKTHTHTLLTALFPGLPLWAGTRKAKPIWILLK